MIKVLVTGANGFIGYKTLKFLSGKKYEVHALTRKSNYILDDNNAIWHNVDLFDYEMVEDVLKVIMPDYILHLAWYTTPGKYNNAQENLDWVQCSIELLKKFKKYGGKRFIFAGTCFQYDLNYGYLTEEITPSKPNSLYGVCKNSFEDIAYEYCNSNNISFASGRIFYVYGEGENRDRVIPYIINSLIKNKITNCSHGNQIRDFMHVIDVANAFVEILDSGLTGVINIGSGKPLELKDILLKIGEKLNNIGLLKLGSIETGNNEAKVIVANNCKLRNNTKWIQRHTLDEGIDITIDWWKKVIKKNEK